MLGIIGAMPEEVEQLKQEMDQVQVISAAGMEFYKGRLEGRDVVVVRCGVGKVNAAMCVQVLADRFEVNGIIHGFCTEMEGAAIAQAAHLNQVPFLIVRAISDKADDSATMDYPEFERQAIIHSTRLTKELVLTCST